MEKTINVDKYDEITSSLYVVVSLTLIWTQQWNIVLMEANVVKLTHELRNTKQPDDTEWDESDTENP